MNDPLLRGADNAHAARHRDPCRRLVALDATAQEAGKSKRSAKAAYSQKAKKAVRLKAENLCEERAQNEDPTGQFAAFPCWAREAFARGQRIDNR